LASGSLQPYTWLYEGTVLNKTKRIKRTLAKGELLIFAVIIWSLVLNKILFFER